MKYKNLLLQILALLTISIASAHAQSDRPIREVVVQGYGKDVADAAQNAAQNALTQVVGSFIDADKFLAKRTEIQDGLRKETKDIRTSIREYSQGVIKSFEVVDVKQEGLTVVTARVAVRIDDFRVLVKRVSEGTTEVSPGLFAEMKTAERQSEDLAKILHRKIFLPLIDRQYLKIKIENIRPLAQSGFDRTSPIIAALSNVEFSNRNSPGSIISLKATISFDEEFLLDISKVLNEVSSQSKRLTAAHNDHSQYSWLRTLSRDIARRDPPDRQDPNDLRIAIAAQSDRINFITLNSNVIFLVPSNHTPGDLANTRNSRGVHSLDFVVHSVSSTNLAQNLQELLGGGGRPFQALARALNRGTFAMEFKDRDGRVIKTLSISANDRTNHNIMIPDLIFSLGNTSNTPWNLVYSSFTLRELVIAPQRSFYVFFAVDDETLRNTASITARLEK